MKESSVGMDRVGGSALVCVDWPSRVLGGACDKWSSQGAVVRWLRGDRMRTVDGLFDEFAASLQFPWFFPIFALCFPRVSDILPIYFLRYTLDTDLEQIRCRLVKRYP